jgi:hypothetical protein
MRAFSLLALCVLALGASAAPTYSKFFIIMFENHGYNQVMANSYWTSAISGSFQLDNYRGVTHPSQPNYVAQIAGSYFTCTDDSPCNLANKNLVDLLEPAGLTWKSYQENYVPLANGDCNLETSKNGYYRKHNPFMSFTDITTVLARCQKIVPETQFQAYVKANALPNFGYYTPNIDNDSHDQNLDYSGKYYQNWLSSYYFPYVNTTWKDTLFMTTFDEDEGAEGNHVVAFFRHPSLTANAHGTNSYTHYSVTRFVEDNFGLASLGTNDATANDFAAELH